MTKKIAGGRVLETKLMVKGRVRRYKIDIDEKKPAMRAVMDSPAMQLGIDRLLNMFGNDDQQPYDVDQVKSQYCYQSVNGGDMVSMIEIAEYYEDGSTKWELAWIGPDGGDCDREFSNGELNLFFKTMDHAQASAIAHILDME